MHSNPFTFENPFDFLDFDPDDTPSGVIGAGDVGLVLDPSNMATLFQDAAGTSRVTAIGQSVGMIRDMVSGRSATQSTAANCPVLASYGGKPCLQFDGVNDGLATPSITWATDAVTIVAAIRKLSDAAVGIVAELGNPPVTSAGTFTFNAPGTLNPGYRFTSRGTAMGDAIAISGYPAPKTDVITGIGKISTDTSILRANGTQIATAATDQGLTAAYQSAALNIGRRTSGSLHFNGYLFAMFAINRVLTATELALVENWAKSRAGL